MNGSRLALRLWLLTNLVFGIAVGITGICYAVFNALLCAVVAVGIAGLVSLPALMILLTAMPVLKKRYLPAKARWSLLILILFLICLFYGIAIAVIDSGSFNIQTCLAATSILFGCNLISSMLSYKQISGWINDSLFEL